MQLQIGSTFTVDVDEYKPHFESGIQWKCVGGIWCALDYGVATDHYSSTVTVSGSYEEIHQLRDAVIAYVMQGGTAIITCSDAEKIFGHEFLYSSTFTAYIASSEEPFTSTAPDGNALASWTFTLYALTDMMARLKYYPVNFPSTLHSTGVERRAQPHAVDTVMYSGFKQTGFHVKEPTCTVKYRGTSQQIGEAKSWLVNKRTTKFNLSSPSGMFYFAHGVLSQDVYFFDLTDSGNVDQGSLEGELSVTYLLA